MVALWGCVAALAGNRFVGVPTDVEATRTVAASPAAVHAAVADLQVLSELLPDDCSESWTFTSTTAGRGARAMVTYTYGPLRRKLPVVIIEDQPGVLFRLDHEHEKKGFFVQFTYPQVDGGTQIVMSTPLNPPPWPLRPPFYNKVLPAWRACYAGALEALAAKVGS